MGFLVRAIGEPGTVLLASQTEGAQAYWLDSIHVFTESSGTGEGNYG